MNKRLLLCLVSGLLGAAGTIAWTQVADPAPAAAQHLAPPPAANRTATPPPARPAAAPQAAVAAWDDPELTAEERINVRVYELSNRSVVNITTKSQQIDRSAADLIVAVDGQPTKTVDEFLTAIEQHRPGEEVTISLVSEGRPRDVSVRLGTSES